MSAGSVTGGLVFIIRILLEKDGLPPRQKIYIGCSDVTIDCAHTVPDRKPTTRDAGRCIDTIRMPLLPWCYARKAMTFTVIFKSGKARHSLHPTSIALSLYASHYHWFLQSARPLQSRCKTPRTLSGLRLMLSISFSTSQSANPGRSDGA